MDKQPDLDVVRTETDTAPESTSTETTAVQQVAEPPVVDLVAEPKSGWTAAATDTPVLPPAAPTPWDSRWIERGVAAVAILGLIAAAVFFFFQNRSHTHELAYRAEAQNAACAYAPALANYDAKDLDSYFRAVDAGATGDWRKQFDDTRKDLSDVLVQKQVVSKASDIQCAWKSGDENTAQVIVVIGQSLASVSTNGKPEPGQLSVILSLQRTNGTWLTNKVDAPLNTQP